MSGTASGWFIELIIVLMVCSCTLLTTNINREANFDWSRRYCPVVATPTDPNWHDTSELYSQLVANIRLEGISGSGVSDLASRLSGFALYRLKSQLNGGATIELAEELENPVRNHRLDEVFREYDEQTFSFLTTPDTHGNKAKVWFMFLRTMKPRTLRDGKVLQELRGRELRFCWEAQ